MMDKIVVKILIDELTMKRISFHKPNENVEVKDAQSILSLTNADLIAMGEVIAKDVGERFKSKLKSELKDFTSGLQD